MTLVFTWAKYGALVADSLLTSPHSDQTRKHDFPLIPQSSARLSELGLDGIYRNMATKIMSLSPELVLGCAGTMIDSLKLHDILQDDMPDASVSDVESRLINIAKSNQLDLTCTGVIATVEGPICFCFDFGTKEFLHGGGYAIGSGKEYYREFNESSPIYSKNPYQDLEVVYSRVSALMANHYFSNEQLMVNVGGNYSSKVYNGKTFQDPPPTLHLFMTFDTDDDGKIVGYGDYFFVHQIQKDTELLTRRMLKLRGIDTPKNNSEIDVIETISPFLRRKNAFSFEELMSPFTAKLFHINCRVLHKGRILTSSLSYHENHPNLPINVVPDTSNGHQIDIDELLPEIAVFHALSQVYKK
ncbi:MAG: hypothetical protein CMO03_02710 [Thalassospira sp.]|jgi:hypothetical protein|nr:hypothetical protein AUP45_00280 [Thalassospira xiamenensis]MAL28426.1 hypothetical protein [Thalassospira sp.]OCK09288.1 hypothetical protein KO164_3467 [Thalassospira sp. KO164]PXX36739.1 hypothetical protein C7967_1011141 [Thalassospira sp. 11-3]SEE70045.1 hypothetical protein SAMN04515623_3503 [Thalassospira permensis]